MLYNGERVWLFKENVVKQTDFMFQFSTVFSSFFFNMIVNCVMFLHWGMCLTKIEFVLFNKNWCKIAYLHE